MKRALNCTHDMACSHLDALAQELIDTGIFTNAEQIQPGVWTGKVDTTRVYNHDETPQFINTGMNGTPNGLVYAGHGRYPKWACLCRAQRVMQKSNAREQGVCEH